MSIKDKTAIVGVGATDYFKRGQSYPETEFSMACTAILAALDDAGLTIADVDGDLIRGLVRGGAARMLVDPDDRDLAAEAHRSSPSIARFTAVGCSM